MQSAILAFLLVVGSVHCVTSVRLQHYEKRLLGVGKGFHEGDLLLSEKTGGEKEMTALVCSSYCKVQGASSPAPCTAFSVEEGSCKLFTYASAVDQLFPSSPALSYSVPEVLLLRLDTEASGGQYFPRFSTPVAFGGAGGSWALNKDSPGDPRFSRLDELEDFVGSDGVYHLKLCYPRLAPSGQHCIMFDQKSDMRLSTPPQGVVIHFHPRAGCEGSDWNFKGLVADTQDSAWLDGNPNPNIFEDYWFYSVGASRRDLLLPSGHFPSFNCFTDNMGLDSAVELYAMLM